MEEENGREKPFRDLKMFSDHETWRKLTRNVKLFEEWRCMDIWIWYGCNVRMYRWMDGWMEYVGGCIDVYGCIDGLIGSMFMNVKLCIDLWMDI